MDLGPVRCGLLLQGSRVIRVVGERARHVLADRYRLARRGVRRDAQLLLRNTDHLRRLVDSELGGGDVGASGLHVRIRSTADTEQVPRVLEVHLGDRHSLHEHIVLSHGLDVLVEVELRVRVGLSLAREGIELGCVGTPTRCPVILRETQDVVAERNG